MRILLSGIGLRRLECVECVDIPRSPRGLIGSPQWPLLAGLRLFNGLLDAWNLPGAFADLLGSLRRLPGAPVGLRLLNGLLDDAPAGLRLLRGLLDDAPAGLLGAVRRIPLLRKEILLDESRELLGHIGNIPGLLDARNLPDALADLLGSLRRLPDLLGIVRRLPGAPVGLRLLCGLPGALAGLLGTV